MVFVWLRGAQGVCESEMFFVTLRAKRIWDIAGK